MIDKRSFILSLSLHLAIGIFILIPWSWNRPEWELSKPVPVRIVPMDLLTQSPAPAIKKEFNKFKEVTTQERTPYPSKKPLIEKSEDKTEPKPSAPSKNSEKKGGGKAAVVKSDPLKTVPPIEKPEDHKLQKPSSVSSAAPNRPSASTGSEYDEQKNSAKKVDEKFESILKSLEQNVDRQPSSGKAPSNAFEAENISDKLSLSELDALRQQIQECWYIQKSVWEDHNLKIEAVVEISPDRKVQRITIKPPPLLTNRSAFNAAADSVRQALRAPECTPLALPENKYQYWKQAKFTFNPKGIM